MFFRELPPKPFDENLLVNRINIEQHDQRYETKNCVLQLDSKEAFRVLKEGRERQRKNPARQQEYDQERGYPSPPIHSLNVAQACYEITIRTFLCGEIRRCFGLTLWTSRLFSEIQGIGPFLLELRRAAPIWVIPSSYLRWYFPLIAIGYIQLHT